VWLRRRDEVLENLVMVEINGPKLRSLREGKDWSQERLAKESRVGKRTIQKAEQGAEIKLVNAELIREALGLGVVDEIIVKKPERKKPAGASRKFDLAALRADRTHGSAKCCAFVAGDFSVLVDKRAVAFTVEPRMHVFVSPAETTTAEIWVPGDGTWTLDAPEKHSTQQWVQRLSTRLTSPAFRHWFDWCPKALKIAVVSELPADVALYEETAIAVAMARALEDLHGQNGRGELLPRRRLAAALLSTWYADVSWATVVACTEEYDDGLVAFDRRNDGNIGLVDLYMGVEKGIKNDWERNVYPKEPFWESERMEFKLKRLSVWWGETMTEDVSAGVRFHDATFDRLRAGYVLDGFEAVNDGGGEEMFRKVGLLMQLHHLELDSAGLVNRAAFDVIKKINALPGVLGAKLACARGSGAVVVLTDKNDVKTSEQVEEKLRRLKLSPLEELRFELNPNL
jgi:mevalonate kinase/DNA-binding XRE family transcriptional regulator